MPPEGYYGFWDDLMEEQGVYVTEEASNFRVFEQLPNYNVGDVIMGEIVEDE